MTGVLHTVCVPLHFFFLNFSLNAECVNRIVFCVYVRPCVHVCIYVCVFVCSDYNSCVIVV